MNEDKEEKLFRWLNTESRGVIFDMDGLMLDTEVIYREALEQAAGDFGYTIDDELFASMIGRKSEDCERLLVDALGRDFPLVEVKERWGQVWLSHLDTHGIAHKPGLINLLDFLEAEHVHIAVATSSSRDIAEHSLRTAGIRARFSFIISGDQVLHGKPSPDIFLQASRNIGLEPEACVVLEDSNPGILAAASAGMLAIMVPDMAEPSDEAMSAALAVLSSLDRVIELVADRLRSTIRPNDWSFGAGNLSTPDEETDG